ncbi:hypothetical protein CY35_03G038000 [Sphagnum magellanicum]|nr:hypothetical protein CY35_03G038000 [Sphagnum magellanicum]KAH9567682.1 hypothetical protein CY35_03G038000 [Sphagnum magellanicum]
MDGKMFQLMLTFIRNLLAVDDSFSPLTRTTTSGNALASYFKDELLKRLFEESVTDLLLALTQHVGGDQPFLRKDNLLILEIFNYLFWGQSPDVIATSSDRCRKPAKKLSQESSAALESLIRQERLEQRNFGFAAPRHSRFCGTFVRVEKDGAKMLVTKNPYQSPLDFKKPEIMRGHVKRVAPDLPPLCSSNDTVCGLLKSLADQFLEGTYNLLMQTVKDDIQSERNEVQESDVVTFFAVANFCTSYQRCLLSKPQWSVKESLSNDRGDEGVQKEAKDMTFQGRCGPIASTMDEDMFNLVTRKWQVYVDTSKETSDWFPPTSAGVLFKEMIHMIDHVLKAADWKTSDGQKEARVARILLYKIFYDHTDQGVLAFMIRLLRTFDLQKQPRSQLAGMIEMTHVVLRLLDTLTKEEGALRVKKKAHNVRSREKKSKQNGTPHQEQSPSQGHLKEGQQRSELHIDVREHDAESGLGEHKVTKDVEEIGTGMMQETPETIPPSRIEELETRMEDREEEAKSDPLGEEEAEQDAEEEEEHDRDPSDSQDEEVEEVTCEDSLDVFKYLRRFGDNMILHNYCWLLKNYAQNTAATNYYIIHMLQRICKDCLMEPMLYQLSVLQTFYEILSNQSIQQSEQHRFVVAFLTKVVRHLFQKLKKSPLLFVDLLFWKTKQDCHCITADYVNQDLRKSLSKTRKEKISRNSIQDRRALLIDSLGDDDEDVNQSPPESSLHRMHNSEVGGNAAENGKVKRHRVSKKRGPFSDSQEDQIKELFAQYKESRSCTKLIVQALLDAGVLRDSGEPFSVAQVGRVLKQLGLERVRKKVTSSKLLQTIGSDNEATDGDDTDDQEEYGLVTQNEQEGQDRVSSGTDDTAKLNDGDAVDDTLDRNSEGHPSNRESKPDLKTRGKTLKDRKKPSGSNGSNKKQKTCLFNNMQDKELQALFAKYQGQKNCIHLISQELEGEFTAAQIGQRLLLLGCDKSKKRKQKPVCQSIDDNYDACKEVHHSLGRDDGGDKDADHMRDFMDVDEDLAVSSNETTQMESEAGVSINRAFCASLGSFARKKFRKQNDYGDARDAEIETDQTNGCESTTPEEIDDDDDLPISSTLSWKKTFESRKRNQKESVPEAGIEADHTNGLESTEPEEIDDDDDDLPIAKTLSGKKTFESRKRNQKESVPKAGIEADHSNGHESTEPEEIDNDDDLPIANTLSGNKTYERRKRSQKEHVPKVGIEAEQTNGHGSTEPEEIDDDDDLPIANTLSWKKTYESPNRHQKESVPTSNDFQTEDTENMTLYDVARKHKPDGLTSFDDTQATHDNQTSRPKRRRLGRKHATNEGEIGRVEEDNENTMNKASKLRDGKGVSRMSRQAWHSDSDEE